MASQRILSRRCQDFPRRAIYSLRPTRQQGGCDPRKPSGSRGCVRKITDLVCRDDTGDYHIIKASVLFQQSWLVLIFQTTLAYPNNTIIMYNSTSLTGLLPRPHGNATLLASPDLLCTLATCDLTLAHFKYLPSIPGNALFAAIFAGCVVIQLILGIKYRTWGFMAAAVCIFSMYFPLLRRPFRCDPSDCLKCRPCWIIADLGCV